MNRKSFATASLILLATLAAMTSCSADQDIEQALADGAAAQSDRITFSVVNAVTNARTSTRDMSTAVTGFRVSALDCGHAYFSSPINVFSTDNGSSWTSSSRATWPAGSRDLTFVAFVDDSGSFAIGDGTARFADYEVPADVSRQSDLMYAVSGGVSRDSSRGGVSLRFRHALSQISFTAQNNHPAYSDIEILSIELGGVKGKGTYTFPQESTGSAASGEWSVAPGASDRSYRIDGLSVSLGACDSSLRGGKVVIGGTTRAEEGTAMYLMPQKAEEGAYIKVRARMTLSGTDGVSYETEETLPITVDWKEGQRYSYSIAWNATPITFDVRVSNFREVSATAE